LEKAVVGGLAAVTDSIENYPGFPKGVGGIELSNNLRAQAERFGTKIDIAEVTALKDEGQYKRVVTTNGDYLARTILIATGSDHKRLGVPGEEQLYGRGVHYCATCDGPLYKDKKLVVVGSGNSAAQEALFLTKFATHVDILIRGEHWKASEVLVENIQHCKDITVHFDTVTERIEADSKSGLVSKVLARNVKTNKAVDFVVEGVFVFVGLDPNTKWLGDTNIELDDIGFVKTNRSLETNIAGIFCAGDVRSGATQQIASAVGEGATAALMMREYLKDGS
jgi:thioredoxin reductase (NADPH)